MFLIVWKYEEISRAKINTLIGCSKVSPKSNKCFLIKFTLQFYIMQAETFVQEWNDDFEECNSNHLMESLLFPNNMLQLNPRLPAKQAVWITTMFDAVHGAETPFNRIEIAGWQAPGFHPLFFGPYTPYDYKYLQVMS